MAPEAPKKSFNFGLLKRLLTSTKPYKSTLALTLTLSISIALISPVRPFLIQQSVDKYIAHHLLMGLIYVCCIQLGMLLLETGIRIWFVYRINWLGQTVVNDIRKQVFQKLIHQNIAYYDKTPIGTLTTRTINDLEAVNDVFSEGLISIIADILNILAVISVMLYTDWRLTLVCLSVFPLLIIATYFFKESVNKSFKSVRNAVAALNTFVQEHLIGMYLVQTFAVEDKTLNEFKDINKTHRAAHIKSILAYSIFFPVVEIVLAMALGLLVWYGSIRLINHGATSGVVIAFVMYLNLLFRPLRMLADKFNVLQMGIIAGERVFSVLDSPEYLTNSGTHKSDKVNGDISFENVHFSYNPGVPVLKGVSFHVGAGKTMAVVGHTGAGKSSIISILNRQYEINSGSIKIDGIPIQDYDVHSLRAHIGIVLQDVFLFSGTISDNISLRYKSISREKIVDVCKLLGIHPFIMQLPGNYDYDVMERGNTLSQGQKQLISFARALLYNPSILILDEATSSVDSESEILIQKAIDKLIQGRTSIVIAHRLSTIRKADEIWVLDHGKVLEHGTHQELLDLKGAYHNLYTAVETAA
jgi:ATP-binding cassette subfamily B protein